MKPVYSIDKKAPRMKKGKFSKMVVTIELWKRFITTYPEYKEMKWREFYNNWGDIAKTIRDETITNPLGVKLEKFAGELKLQYLPYRLNTSDNIVSEQLGEKVNFLNIETRGKVAKLKWERREAVKRNKILQFYAFDGTRELCKMANKYIHENPDSLRTARVTLGGHSVWRTKIK